MRKTKYPATSQVWFVYLFYVFLLFFGSTMQYMHVEVKLYMSISLNNLI